MFAYVTNLEWVVQELQVPHGVGSIMLKLNQPLTLKLRDNVCLLAYM